MLDQLIVTGSDGSGLPLAPDVMRALAGQFPSVHLAPPHAWSDDGVAIGAAAWCSDAIDGWALDCAVDDADERGDFVLRVLDADRGGAVCLEILNRCQRTIRRRNHFSQNARFDSLLSAHRGMHDLAKPLVRADFNHARDTWQWVLRLDREASLPLQLAALFHDVERLATEADRRVEHLSANYQRFKDRHAAGSASITGSILTRIGIDAQTCKRTVDLIAAHERYSEEDVELRLLNEADALSFFSLNSGGFYDYFGPDHTRKKIRYTLGRLGDRGRAHLAGVRMRHEVRELFEECGG
ncbi:MAG: DUF4202 family protein [Acidobacteria bacterium]|nr:DUF4202 family protein [Acidobacteriota bacterium]